MAKKAKKKSIAAKRVSSKGSMFDQHPNLKMLMYMFVLSLILWVLTIQL